MKTEPNDNALPNAEKRIAHNIYESFKSVGGLTKREHFAAMAMQAYLSCPDIGATGYPISMVADMSCEAADALITALNK